MEDSLTNTVQSLSNGYRIFGVSGFWGFEFRALKGVIHGTTIHGIVGRMRQTIEMTKKEMCYTGLNFSHSLFFSNHITHTSRKNASQLNLGTQKGSNANLQIKSI